MVNSMVARATSDMLIGPDWAMNIEICDICNHDPVQAKDVVKGIKKRLGSRNPKVQLLALTLLETIVKNCGDFVHMHVAERDLLHDMVKIVKKKPDFHVKEKILILIDTWQEAFGGARARYPQYYAAYHELLRLGASFPQRSERSTPVLTPPQTQALTSYPHNLGNPENENTLVAPSADNEFASLSLTEMQNARGIMDVLAEMLTAIDPEKKEGLKQEVIVDLVDQCRTYKKRVVHLVNSTSDESLLCQGLALNDDLERVLGKHESLVTGIPQKLKDEKSKAETIQALVPVDTPLIDATDTKQLGSATRDAAVSDLISLAPITTNGQSTSQPKVNPKFDLLSGDDFNSPTAANSLAIVPISGSQPATPVTQQNALAVVDMFSQNNVSPPVQQQMYSSPPQQLQQPQNLPAPPRHESWAPYNQGNNYNNNNDNYNNNNPVWNGNVSQQQQPSSSGFGGQTSGGLPPPPWETPANMNHQMPPMNNHMPPVNNQPVYIPQQLPQQQMAYMYPQQMGQQMYSNQMGQNYGYGGGYGYGYGQQQNAQYIDQRMAGMSMSTVYTGPSMANASYVHVPSGKPQKAEDKLFGDLVDFAKVKPNKPAPARAGSM